MQNFRIQIKKFFALIYFSILFINGFSQCNFYSFYKLDANTSDEGANNLHGDNNGALGTLDRLGDPNSAMAFDGVNDYIELPSDFDFVQRTINIWFKAESSNTSANTIYDSDHPALNNGSTKMYVKLISGTTYIAMSTGNSGLAYTDEPINLNQWYMGTIVVGSSDVKYYLNAQLIATFPLNISSAVNGNVTAVIGCTRVIDRFFDGDIDDVSIFNCALDLQSIDSLYNISILPPPPANNCVVANYYLNSNAADSSGSFLNGTNYGSTPSLDRFGNLNLAMSFDGIGDYIELPSDFDYPQRTINTWFKAESSTTAANTIYDSDHPALNNGSTKIYVKLIGSTTYLAMSTGNSGLAYYETPINLNQWYMATIVVGATDVKYYLNSNLIATFSLNISSALAGNSTAVVGCTRLIDRFFDGNIDDLSIYDCPLGQTEIDSLYAIVTIAPPPPPVTNCLVANYFLDSNTADSSGFSNHGINNGATSTSDRFSNFNSAMSFGGGDYIELPSDFDYPQRTINFWFNSTSSSTQPRTIYDSDYPGLNHGSTKSYVMIYGGQTSICFSMGNSGLAFHNEPINLNQWYMATIVIGTDAKYYVNSQLVATFPLNISSATNGNNTALIGCTRLIDRFFEGVIDDFSIYDCPLAQSQIDSIYDNFVPPTNISCTAAQYYFNGNTDDNSGNGFDGAATNITLTTDLFGDVNSACHFSDSLSNVDLSDDFDFTERTVNLWFKGDDIDTLKRYLYDSDHASLNNGSTKMWVRDTASVKQLGFSVGVSNINTHYETINENQWYMATLVATPTNVIYYLNGQEIYTGSPNTSNSGSGFDHALIGNSTFYDGNFNGIIDNVTIYQCDMDPSFIDSLFQLGSAALQPVFCDLEANTISVLPTCFGGSNGSIDVSVIGNNGPVSYSWSNGSTLSFQNNLTAGSYDIYVIDTTGCDTLISLELLDPTPIQIDYTVIEPDCNTSEGEIEILVTNAASPITIDWSTGDTTLITDSIPAGLYFVEILDDNGCTASQSIALNNGNSMSVSDTIVSNTACPSGNTGYIDMTLTGGVSPFNYLWSNGSTTEDVYNLGAGQYDVIVTDGNGCVLTASFEVGSPAPFNYSFNIQPSFCNSSNGVATINVSGGTSPYFYQWITGATTSSVSGLSVGYYSVEVSDINGCNFSDIAVINEYGGPQIATDNIIQPTCGGSNGEVAISIYAGTPPFDYQWSDNSTSQDLTGATNGMYSVLVTGANGCSSVGVYDLEGTTPDSIEICIISVDSLTQRNLIIWEKPITSDIDYFNIYKETSSANVYNLVGAVDYDSLSVFLDSTANPQVRGWRYKITAMDFCGNESMQSQFHKTLHLNANIGVGGIINLDWDEYSGFNYSTFYIWRYDTANDWIILDSVPSNLFSYTDLNPPVGVIDYYIEVRKSAGCNPSRSGEISSRSNTKSQNSSGNSIEENQKDILNIYPNPATDLLYAELTTGKLNARFDILDVSGKLVYSGTLSSQPISIKELSRGLYTIHVILENENYIQKFIKN